MGDEKYLGETQGLNLECISKFMCKELRVILFAYLLDWLPIYLLAFSVSSALWPWNCRYKSQSLFCILLSKKRNYQLIMEQSRFLQWQKKMCKKKKQKKPHMTSLRPETLAHITGHGGGVYDGKKQGGAINKDCTRSRYHFYEYEKGNWTDASSI